MPFKARPTPGAHIRIRCFFFFFFRKSTEDAEVSLSFAKQGENLIIFSLAHV